MPVTNSLRLRGEDFAGARDCAARESHHQWAFSAAKRQAGARAEATGRRRLRRGELWRSEQNHPSWPVVSLLRGSRGGGAWEKSPAEKGREEVEREEKMKQALGEPEIVWPAGKRSRFGCCFPAPRA